MYLAYVLPFFVILFNTTAINTISPCTPVVIQTIYGSAIITEPVLIELLNSQAMARLKQVNQYGIMKFLTPEQEYTRYQHSVGVLYLLRHFGASLEEQVMGLLHDVSHTAFSHVADYLFGTVLDYYSYQDKIFEWYVAHTDLGPILERYNMSWICPLEAHDQFRMLKDKLPNLCVDRLEYNLHGGYLEGILTEADIQFIVNSLHYHDKQWIFENQDAAQLFADVALHLTVEIWCADWNCFVYSETAALLKRALAIGLITENELIFSDDATIWHKLTTHDDAVIQQQINCILNYRTHFTHGAAHNCDYTTQGKFRWIDPLVMKDDDTAVRLSALEPSFEEYIIAMKERFKEPHYIRYISIGD